LSCISIYPVFQCSGQTGFRPDGRPSFHCRESRVLSLPRYYGARQTIRAGLGQARLQSVKLPRTGLLDQFPKSALRIGRYPSKCDNFRIRRNLSARRRAAGRLISFRISQRPMVEVGLFLPHVRSSLPNNSCVFQRDRNVFAAPYHPRGIVRW
jgi:hypothetical protein